MTKEKYTLTEQLDPKDVTDISEGHKASLMASGLFPYRTSHGRIVWANDATRIYKMGKRNPAKSFRLFRQKPLHKANRIKRGMTRMSRWQLLKDFLPFFLLLLAIAVFLVAVVKYNFLIG